MKSIFKPIHSYFEFYIKAGKKCPTNCSSCHFANSKEDYYELENLKERIDIGYSLFDCKDFHYFIYGVDVLESPYYDELFKYLSQKGRKFKIQIGLNDIVKKIIILEELYKKYGGFEITLAIEIHSVSDMKSVLESFSYIQKLNNIRCSYDLIIDFKKHKAFVDKLKKLFHDNYRFDSVYKVLSFSDVGNINLGISQMFHFVGSKKTIENVPYKSCVMPELFSIKNNRVYLEDHIELDKDMNLLFHTPLCFLAQIKIASLNDSDLDILTSFSKFHKDTLSVQGDMNKKCFTCISNKYPLI